MKIIHRSFWALAWAFAAGAAAWACDDSAAASGSDAGTDTDTDIDTDTDVDTDADSDTDTDADSDAEASWEGVELEDVSAPDELTVVVGFVGTPPVADAGDASIYSLASDVGGLAVESASYDAADHVATLTTAKQKLGITYTLTVQPPGEVTALQADFLSAETATFWILDFATEEYEQITAERGAVGEHCVAYVQEGYFAFANDAQENFDANVFPIETELFTGPPDMDDNDRIVMLGLDGGGYYGGYFDPINTYTEAELEEWGYTGYHSNEMEIIYIAVEWGDFDGGRTIVPHEFQHLLYQQRHPFNDYTDTYHNEGLAECAVRAVNGEYPQDIGYYFGDPGGLIGGGEVSLVNWTYSLYENYVVAFMFWSYIASQLDGVYTYGEIFDLDSGSPDTVQEFLVDALGIDFGETQLDQMIAVAAQAEAGIYGYNGFIDVGSNPPHVEDGVSSVQLQPFAGTFFPLDQASVDYPGTQGDDIVYAGVNGAGEVDLEAPFDVDGGALVVLNANFEFDSYPEEHSGPDVAAVDGKVMKAAIEAGDLSPTWTDPPPSIFARPDLLRRWIEARKLQLGVAPLQ
jgi:hypothetical protein